MGRSAGCSFLLAALAVSSAFSQVTAGSNYQEILRKTFDAIPASSSSCAVTPIPPSLDFSLRFQTGFMLQLPPDAVTKQHGAIVLRVTPESEAPVYLLSLVRFPGQSKARLSGQFRGGFVVGAGAYQVEMVFQNDQNWVCRSQWKIEAKPDGSERRLQKARPAGRLTILMHISPPSPSLAKLPEGEQQKLLGTLFALLRNSNGQPVRLVAFDLEQQKVLFRKDQFGVGDMKDVAAVMRKTPFGVVDYSTLRNPKGAADLLAQLTEEESQSLRPSDVMVFLGSHEKIQGSISSDTVKKLHRGPRIFYLECEPLPAFGPSARVGNTEFMAQTSVLPAQSFTSSYGDFAHHFAAPDEPDTVDDGSIQPPAAQPDNNAPVFSPQDQPDMIEQLVGRLRGKVILIRTPGDCARAVCRILDKAKAKKP